MKKHIYIIAGEKSGDVIGADIIASLQALDTTLTISGVGGEAMAKNGLNSLFPYTDLAVMGVSDVLKSYRRIKKRISDTINDIKIKQPDVVVTIDAQGFSKRVALGIKDLEVTKIHVVAPTVWAWRAGRVHTYKKIFDSLLCLFSFEPKYFKAVGMPAHFVGHPCVDKPQGDGVAFCKRHKIDKNATVLGFMAGSRKSEVASILDTYINTCKALVDEGRDIHIVAPVVTSLENTIKNALTASNLKYTIVGENEKNDAFYACDVALATSGTVTLELAVASIPMVVGYKTSWLTYNVLRHFFKIKYFSLPNILLESQGLVPEFIQGDCNVKNLSNALINVIDRDGVHQRKEFYSLNTQLHAPNYNGKNMTMGESSAIKILELMS